jgi:hypothetical protein
MQDPIAPVGAIYAAFGCGDIAAILDRLAPGVAWEAWFDMVNYCPGMVKANDRQE